MIMFFPTCRITREYLSISVHKWKWIFSKPFHDISTYILSQNQQKTVLGRKKKVLVINMSIFRSCLRAQQFCGQNGQCTGRMCGGADTHVHTWWHDHFEDPSKKSPINAFKQHPNWRIDGFSNISKNKLFLKSFFNRVVSS